MTTQQERITLVNGQAHIDFDLAWPIISTFTSYHKQQFFDKYGVTENGMKLISLHNQIIQKLDKKNGEFDEVIHKKEQHALSIIENS